MRKVCRHGKLAGSLGSVLGGCGDGLGLGWKSRWLLEVPWVMTQGNTRFLGRTRGRVGLLVRAFGGLEMHGEGLRGNLGFYLEDEKDVWMGVR